MPPEGIDASDAGASIVIVEDNAVNALILSSMLRKRGYASVVAADGAEGVAMARGHRPRLVLMDLQLPRLDGFAAAAEIRRKAAGAIPAIVAVTANPAAEVRRACEVAGFAGLIAKPIDYAELMAAVAKAFGGA